MTIKLSEDVEQALAEAARRQGTTPDALANATLRDTFASTAQPSPPNPPGSLAEYLADFIGCIDSSEHIPGGAQMSRDTGKQFTDGMAEKHRLGKL